MKGLELNVTKQNGMTLVEYQLGAADVYDDRVSDKVAQLGNIIPFQYKDEDGKRSIVSYVHHDTSLEVMLRQTLKKADVLAILKGLLCAFEIGAAGVQICYLVRDLNYIYVDPESKAVKCIMVPVKQDPLGQSDIPDFFRNIVSHMRFDEADKDDYVARILTLINTDHYSNMKLKGLVDAEMEKLGLFYTRDEGLKKEADTTAAPEVQNQNVKVNRVGVMNNMRPQGMPAMGQPMGQPVPPMGGQPMMGQPVPPMGGQPMMGQPVPPMGRQPMMGQPVPPMGRQPMGQPVPPMGGQQMGQPVPPMGGQPMGQPVPPMGQMPKPEMPKPQAPAPEAPKPEMPKPEMPKPQAPVSEAPKPEMPKPEMPKPQAPVPEAPKPEMPKPEMPKPQAPAPEAPKPEMPKPEMPKPQMPPMGQRPAMGGQPMMGQPVPPMGGQRPPMGQPMMGQPMMGQMPRPQAPQMQNGNLMGQLGGARPIPHFVRKSTGEIINITKPEFIIGKSKTKADYAIENNSAISREHCIVIQRDGVNYIKDNNSTNHTYVNGVELQPGKEVLLKHKTEVRLGDEEFTFLLRKGE
ncbi:FHA domain-containing protein [Wujia chipingensis]|uniref:FHA domain-containing protein n=2 Tax=Lachnospiraceae TaxID=186803 RepID=A0A7G9FN89_9FIRM|nr:FHA domain-containing protein [Wujia chipingensis]QNM00021.1 FHA domain-containing protein [Wujia chipingensis]